MSKPQTKLLLALGVGILSLMPQARADEWNQKTIFTFSGPVAIPGQTLPAGTYVFKLHNSHTYRHIVQVYNKDKNHVFGTFLAIPDYHLKPSSEPIVKFHEEVEGAPQAIKAWFYPGRTYGHEFVYPKNKARTLAAANQTPVPAMPTELAEDTNKPDVAMDSPEVAALDEAHLMAEEPSGDEVELPAAFMLTMNRPSPHQAELPDELPSTASQLPLFGAGGIVLLGCGLALRRAASKMS